MLKLAALNFTIAICLPGDFAMLNVLAGFICLCAAGVDTVVE